MKLPLRLELVDTAEQFYTAIDGTYEVLDADGMPVLHNKSYYPVSPDSVDDARRIVASVNLLHTFSVEQLEAVVGKVDVCFEYKISGSFQENT